MKTWLRKLCAGLCLLFLCSGGLPAEEGPGTGSESDDTPGNKTPVRIACVGDSITFGARIKDREQNCYPAQLQRKLGDGYEVRNFGVSGATLLKHVKKAYWKTEKFQSAHTFNPDIVIIKLGTNDAKPENWRHKGAFVADYAALIGSFRVLSSKPLVYICRPVPAYPDHHKISSKVVREEVVPKIDQVGKQERVTVIDLYTALSNRKNLFPDKLHPNAAGAKIMAETIYPFCIGKR